MYVTHIINMYLREAGCEDGRYKEQDNNHVQGRLSYNYV
jgi:hypothetical protein